MPFEYLHTSHPDFKKEHLLAGFYLGWFSNEKGLFLRDMLEMSNPQLEKSHDVIQWMFPLNEPSAHNPKAPILTKELIDDINQGHRALIFKHNFTQAWARYMFFLCSAPTDWGMFTKENWETQIPYEFQPQWVTPRNHNYLRITRVIKSSLLFGRQELAQKMYDYACQKYQEYPNIIGPRTKQFWDDAIIPSI
jgi:hypothetical protein